MNEYNFSNQEFNVSSSVEEYFPLAEKPTLKTKKESKKKTGNLVKALVLTGGVIASTGAIAMSAPLNEAPIFSLVNEEITEYYLMDEATNIERCKVSFTHKLENGVLEKIEILVHSSLSEYPSFEFVENTVPEDQFIEIPKENLIFTENLFHYELILENTFLNHEVTFSYYFLDKNEELTKVDLDKIVYSPTFLPLEASKTTVKLENNPDYVNVTLQIDDLVQGELDFFIEELGVCYGVDYIPLDLYNLTLPHNLSLNKTITFTIPNIVTSGTVLYFSISGTCYFNDISTALYSFLEIIYTVE